MRLSTKFYIMEDFVVGNLELAQNVADGLEKSERWPEERENFKRLYEGYQKFLSSETFKSGNQVFGNYTQSLIKKYLNDLKSLINSQLKCNKKALKNQIRCVIDKLRMIFESLPSCYLLDVNDLECLPPDHPRHIALNSVTTIHTSDLKTYSTQLSKFLVKYNALTVAFLEINKFKPSCFRDLLTGAMIVYYLTQHKKREKLLALYNIKLNIECISMLFRFTESNLARKLLPLSFPSIRTSELIHIPRLSPVVNDNSIKTFLPFEPFSLSPDPSKVSVRIICRHKINLKSANNNYNRLIIHVHGGGFVSQTSFSHQHYLRAWANEIDYPIFSVDYRLAPDHKFPAGIDDVWQAYTWLINNIESALGIVPEKVVLIGDSAGGNFITGITLKAKEFGFRQPDSLLMIYPSMNMQAKYISSGAFYSLEDPLLTYGSFFEICKYYVNNPEDLDSYLVSPVLCPSHLLKNFPTTRLMLTWLDPLRSDNMRFMDRLLQHQADVQIQKYPEYVHGALNLATPNNVPMLKHFIFDALNLLKPLIS